MRISYAMSSAILLSTCTVNAASLKAVAPLPEECASVQLISSQIGWCGDLHVLFQTVDGGQKWTRLNVPARQLHISIPSNLWDFQLLRESEGWVRTDVGLLWTEDAGQTWSEYPLPLTSMVEGRVQGLVDNMHFTTRQIGWALGRREVPGDPLKEDVRYRIAGAHSVYVPALFRTLDHGSTWTAQTYPDLGGLSDRLEFADADHGLSVELNATLYTHDGGSTWKRSRYCRSVNEKELHNAELGTGTFWRTTAQLLDTEFGWWSVEGDLFRTTNGGATWCRLEPIRYKGEIVPVHQIRFATRDFGLAVPDFLGHFDDPTPPFETRNGGRSWNPIRVPPNTHIEGCSVVTGGSIYCWGSGSLYRLARD